MSRVLPALVAVLAATVAGATAAAVPAQTTTGPASTQLTPLQRPTPLSSFNGWILFSRWDGAAYHLSTWHAGQVTDLAAPAQAQPFDADAGPDSKGQASAAYSACAKSCDLFLISFARGAQPRPVTNANSGDDEIAPTIWKGQIAFARRFSKDQVVPYTKLLNAPRSTPSTRLAGLPSQRCGAVDPPDCRPIKDVGPPALELWGQWVAQSWTYQPDDFPGFRQNEIRLTNVSRTDTRQLASMVTGLGGQTYLGPSVVNGQVAFFRACQGDPGGCSTSSSGAIRYAISKKTYDLDGANEAWTGWAYGGAADVHVPSDFDCSGGDPQQPPSEPCGIVQRTDLSFTPVAASKIKQSS